jgi:two-component system sensor histidine kinase DesK
VTVAAAPYRTNLRYLRRITLWSLLLFVGAITVMVTLEVINRWTGPRPAMLLMAVAVVGTCGISVHFMRVSVLAGGPPPMTRRVGLAFAGAAAVTLAAAVAAAPLYRTTPDVPMPWLLLAALLVSAAVAGSGLPRFRTTVAGTVLVVAAGAAGAVVAGRELLPAVGVDAIATVAASSSVAAQLWFWDVATQVDRARQVEGEAAVANERLRFAAELHDIQGHSLQVIALKSELAARLVQSDPERAVAEMREVESLARQALRDTREVAHGYRTVSLATEIANATRVLAAAGVRCTTRQDEGLPTLVAATERLLGLVVREATTNVIRHSRAGSAEIALTRHDGGVRLLVRNDAPLTASSATAGGLAGLADRFAAAGGTLAWRREDDSFTVTAEVASG